MVSEDLMKVAELRTKIIDEIGALLSNEKKVHDFVYIMSLAGVIDEEVAQEYFSAYKEFINKYNKLKKINDELNEAVKEGDLEKIMEKFVESTKLLPEVQFAYNRYMEEREIMEDKLGNYDG